MFFVTLLERLLDRWPPTKGLKTCFFLDVSSENRLFFYTITGGLLGLKNLSRIQDEIHDARNEVREDASLYTEMKHTPGNSAGCPIFGMVKWPF